MRLLARLQVARYNAFTKQNLIQRQFKIISHCPANRLSCENKKMNPQDKFLFDLNGFIVVRNVLNKTEIDDMNSAIDEHMDKAKPRESEDGGLRNTKSGTYMSAQGPRIDLGGLLNWESPAFRRLLAHPKLIPYLISLLGHGYRMDHQPFVIIQNANSEGFSLHGGPLVPSSSNDSKDGKEASLDVGLFNPELQYSCRGGKMWNSLLAMSVCLCDANPGDGGFCVVRGSHKLNFAMPDAFSNGCFGTEHIYQPEIKKGDVIFFSEATIHGALPWMAKDKQRRVALYRFAPSTVAYGRMYIENFGDGVLEKCTEEEKVVLTGPYANRVERAYVDVDDEGKVVIKKQARKEIKKDHDKKVFGTDWF